MTIFHIERYIWQRICFSVHNQNYRCHLIIYILNHNNHSIDHKKKSLHARGQNFCANFVPWAHKNRPYYGIYGNSEDQLSYWYYYPCLLQSVPVYLLWKTSNLNVGSSGLSARTSNINILHIIHLLKITKLSHFCAIEHKIRH